jgi:hypothetical protein
MRPSIVAAALLVLSISGCSHYSPTVPSEAVSVVLAPGQSVSYRSLAVRFVGVTADSRCPADATCLQFWAGDATVVVEASGAGAQARHELLINDTSKRRVSHGGFVLELTALSPYPLASRPIAAGDYRATIVVRSE